MTNHVARLYALVLGVVVFFVAWATVAAHPWATQPKAARDPRLVALAARQHRLQVDAVRVRRIVNARWAVYHRALAARNTAAAQQAKAAAQAASAQVSAAPAVRVVNLPPLVVTRTS